MKHHSHQYNANDLPIGENTIVKKNLICHNCTTPCLSQDDQYLTSEGHIADTSHRDFSTHSQHSYPRIDKRTDFIDRLLAACEKRSDGIRNDAKDRKAKAPGCCKTDDADDDTQPLQPPSQTVGSRCGDTKEKDPLAMSYRPQSVTEMDTTADGHNSSMEFLRRKGNEEKEKELKAGDSHSPDCSLKPISLLAYIEDALRLVLHLIPVSEGDHTSEMAFNLVQSAYDILSMYRHHLIRPPLRILGPDSIRRSLIQTMYFILKAIRCVQLLIETWGFRWRGKKSSLELCMKIEMTKMALKFLIWRLSVFRIFVEETRILDVETRESDPYVRLFDDVRAEMLFGSETNRRGTRANIDRQENSTTDFRRSAIRLFDRCLVAHPYPAEVLFHLRPMVYLCLAWWALRSHRHHGRLRWSCWLLCLAVDVVSLGLLRRWRTKHGDLKNKFEAEEIKSRSTVIFLSLIRSPFFEATLERPLQCADRVLKKIPLLCWFNVFDAFLTFRPYHFFSSP